MSAKAQSHREVYQVEFGGPAGAPRVVLVHGLGGSHANWSALGPLLAVATRPVAVDLAGFGFTPGTGREATVTANAHLLADFVRDEIGEPVYLVGNSMGGMISALTAAARPELVLGVVLIDPTLPKPRGVHLDPAIRNQFLGLLLPGVGSKVLAKRQATTTARQRVEATLAFCCADPGRLTPAQVDAEVAVTEARDGSAAKARISAHIAATRSIIRLSAAPAYRRELAAIRAPVLLIHGIHDRLVPIGSADAAARQFPAWDYRRLECGHIPHMELPAGVADSILTWIEDR